MAPGKPFHPSRAAPMQRFTPVALAFLVGVAWRACWLVAAPRRRRPNCPTRCRPTSSPRGRRPARRWGGEPGQRTGFFHQELPEAGDLPAFQLEPWDTGALSKMPMPQRPFGLDLARAGDGRGIEGTRRPHTPPGAVPRGSLGGRRGAEGVCRTQTTPMAESRRPGSDGRGAEGTRRPQTTAIAGSSAQGKGRRPAALGPRCESPRSRSGCNTHYRLTQGGAAERLALG